MAEECATLSTDLVLDIVSYRIITTLVVVSPVEVHVHPSLSPAHVIPGRT